MDYVPRSIELLDESSLRSGMYFARDGTRIAFSTWAALFEFGDSGHGQGSYRTVRRTLLEAAQVEVSTVWLGLDHGHGLSARPLIFESMVFTLHEERVVNPGAEHEYTSDRDAGYMERYSTEQEALAGHRRIVRALRTGAPLDQADRPVD